jgi:type I site-specific restriction-modification system R (restriction) subunit
VLKQLEQELGLGVLRTPGATKNQFWMREPDLVLYVNGIAVGVIELKNSRVSTGEGIRQSIFNQQPEFNAWFFSTVQFIIAGNDSEGCNAELSRRKRSLS